MKQTSSYLILGYSVNVVFSVSSLPTDWQLWPDSFANEALLSQLATQIAQNISEFLKEKYCHYRVTTLISTDEAHAKHGSC